MIAEGIDEGNQVVRSSFGHTRCRERTACQSTESGLSMRERFPPMEGFPFVGERVSQSKNLPAAKVHGSFGHLRLSASSALKFAILRVMHRRLRRSALSRIHASGEPRTAAMNTKLRRRFGRRNTGSSRPSVRRKARAESPIVIQAAPVRRSPSRERRVIVPASTRHSCVNGIAQIMTRESTVITGI
jgi:hypothetical protein